MKMKVTYMFYCFFSIVKFFKKKFECCFLKEERVKKTENKNKQFKNERVDSRNSISFCVLLTPLLKSLFHLKTLWTT